MLLAALVGAAFAEEPLLTRDPEGLGLGLMLGEPTGFSGVWRPGGRFSVDMGLAWSFPSWAQFHTDACLDLVDLRTAELPDMHFPIWLGVGPRFRFGSGTDYDAFNMAIRVPVAMGFWHNQLPIEGFLELAPGVGVFPKTEFTMDVGVGARFFIPVPSTTPRFTSANPEDVEPY